MAGSSRLLLRVWNDWPKTPVFARNAGAGTWPAGTFSFGVVAWPESSEADPDAMGMARYSAVPVSVVLNKAVTLNDSVTISFTPARTPPHHYSFYFQSGASWNYAAAATRLGQIDGSLTSATFTSNAASGSALGDHSAISTLTINPAQSIIPVDKELLAEGIGGQTARSSFGQSPCCMPDGVDSVEAPFSSISLPMLWPSLSQADRVRLLNWWNKGWPVVLWDEGTNATERHYKYYHGRIKSVGMAGSSIWHDQRSGYDLLLRIEGVGLGT